MAAMAATAAMVAMMAMMAMVAIPPVMSAISETGRMMGKGMTMAMAAMTMIMQLRLVYRDCSNFLLVLAHVLFCCIIYIGLLRLCSIGIVLCGRVMW